MNNLTEIALPLTEITEKPPIPIPKWKRFQVYIELKIKGYTNAKIAEVMGISERRLDQHIMQWKDDGTLDKYVFSEWLITYHALQEDGDLKTTFNALTNMLIRRMKEDVQLQGAIEYVLRWIPDDQKGISTAV